MAGALVRAAGLAASLALATALVACVPAGGVPATCGDPAVSLSATVKPGGMEPASLEVCRDQQVTLTITSQVAGDLHFHGYDTEIDEQPVTPGQTLKVEFKAVYPGQFPIELHPEDGSDEVQLGALVVHER
jgi:hypothetical protein